MSSDDVDRATRRAIGGDPTARAWLVARAAAGGNSLAQVVVCVLDGDAVGLDGALRAATSRREREVVEIARAHLAGDRDRVDALARDHLVDHPASIVVAWIAAGATASDAPPGAR